MRDRKLRVLQVSTADIGGGAEKVAWNLFRSYRARGYDSWLAVGMKRSDEPNVIAIPRPRDHDAWSRLWLSLEQRLQRCESNSPALSRAQTALRTLARPRHELGIRLGLEDFDYPGTKQLLELTPGKPDVVHCHNLHGGYFDLRWLPRLSRQAPVVLTLHDAWLLSGHCAHSFECQRWKSGCGRCPDLTIYPAIGRDATAYNWRRKRNIFSKSRIYLSTPSKWLMEKVEQSLLWPSIAEARMIPNGVDLSVFCPAEKGSARAALALPQDAAIVLFTANRAQTNVWKDYKTFRAAMALVAHGVRRRILLLSLGGEAATERVDDGELRSVPYQRDMNTVAQYYQAADLYVHPSRIDTFPCSVLEALACGTPVVATEVGGILEQIKGWRGLDLDCSQSNCYASDDATGVLIPSANAEAMAESIRRLLGDDVLRRQMSENAIRDAQERFSLDLQVDRYLGWYRELALGTVPQESRVAMAV